MNIYPSQREAIGVICVRFFQDNARLRHRLGNDPDVFIDFIRGALCLADEEFDRIVTPEFRHRWSHKSLPVKK